MTVEWSQVLSSLGVALLLSFIYFGLLALIAEGAKRLDAKQALLFVTVSFPMRLALLGLAMAWLLQRRGVVGALAMLPSIWIGRFVTHRVLCHVTQVTGD
jgi:hypothetical protein